MDGERDWLRDDLGYIHGANNPPLFKEAMRKHNRRNARKRGADNVVKWFRPSRRRNVNRANAGASRAGISGS